MVGVYFANETVRDKEINSMAGRICDKLRSVVPAAILVQIRNDALGDESDSALQLCIHDAKKEAWRIGDQTVSETTGDTLVGPLGGGGGGYEQREMRNPFELGGVRG